MRAAAALLVVCLIAWLAEPALAQHAPALERGRALLSEGRLWPAEQAAREAVDEEPTDAAAHQLLAQVLERRGRGDEALVEYERAFALDPALPGIDRELGVARFEQGDRTGAREPLQRAVAASPGDAALRVRLGLCELDAARPEEAARHFEHAADDPVLSQLALYNLGLALLQQGRIGEARDAFERSAAADRETVTGRAAVAALADLPATQATETEEAPELVEERGPVYRLALGAGLAYDDNLVVEEVDTVANRGDGAGVFEASTGVGLPVGDAFDLGLGYDFYQSLYFETTSYDLQSHAFGANATRDFGAFDGTLGYTFSLSTLGGSHFLDFHEVRTSTGFTPTESWYLSPTAAFRVKRFPQKSNSRRDAEQVAVGALQLFALGDWSRYATLGLELEGEDADGSEFDYWGPVVLAGLRSPIPVPGIDLVPTFDARYRFRWRDYLHDDPNIGVGDQRADTIHQLRLRLDVPIAYSFSLRTQYEFEHANSNRKSADYESNRVDVLLRYEL